MDEHEQYGKQKTEPRLGERPDLEPDTAQEPLPEMRVDEDFTPSWLQPPEEPSWLARNTSPLLAWAGVAVLAGVTVFGFVWLQNEQKAVSALDVVAQSTRAAPAAAVTPVSMPATAAPVAAAAPPAPSIQGPSDVPPLVTLPPEEVKRGAVPPLVSLPREEVKTREIPAPATPAPKPVIAKAPVKALAPPPTGQLVKAPVKAPSKPLAAPAPRMLARGSLKPLPKPLAKAPAKPAAKALMARKAPALKPGQKKVLAAAKPPVKGARKRLVVASKRPVKAATPYAPRIRPPVKTAALSVRAEARAPKAPQRRKGCAPGDLARDCLN